MNGAAGNPRNLPDGIDYSAMMDVKASVERVALEMERMDNPNIKLFDELAPAFMGFATRGSSSEPMAAYDYDKCSSLLQERQKWTQEEASEYLEFNYVNAWVGDGTPVFVKTV